MKGIVKRIITKHQKKLIKSILQLVGEESKFRDVYNAVILGKVRKQRVIRSESKCIARTSKLSQCPRNAELGSDYCLKHCNTQKFGRMDETFIVPEGIEKVEKVVGEHTCIGRNANGSQCKNDKVNKETSYCKRHCKELKYGTIYDAPLEKKKKRDKTTTAVVLSEFSVENSNVTSQFQVEEEEELNLELFIHNDKRYWKDENNHLYDDNDNEVGRYVPIHDKVLLF